MRALAFALALLVACAPVKPPPTIGPDCVDMCQAFARLHCLAAEPSPVLGVTCVERCRTQIATDVVAPPIACIVHARDVGELEDLCGERCR